MQKIFYISNNSEGKSTEGVNAPQLDRFQRVEQLNKMLDCGWEIKDFKTAQGGSYFVLEKLG